jgi:hypothetical protein
MTIPDEAIAAARNILRERLNGLMRLPYEQLRALPQSQEDIDVGGLAARLGVFTERPDGSRVSVIAQVYTPSRRKLLFVRVHDMLITEGFDVQPDGTISTIDRGQLEHDYYPE